jgi:hypothetical protein
MVISIERVEDIFQGMLNKFNLLGTRTVFGHYCGKGKWEG